MKRIALPFRLDSGKSWTEEIPEGSRSRGVMSFAADSGQVQMNIKIDGHLNNIRAAIWQIIGYSECVAGVGAAARPFDTNNPNQQGPFRLRRRSPARHPQFPNLVATRILSVQGMGLINAPESGGAADCGMGTYGEYKFAYISIAFEIPRYVVLGDDELLNVQGLENPPEYLRYTEWFYESNVETLARRGQQWYTMDRDAQKVTPTFGDSRLLRQPKGKLKVVWHDVAIDYVMLGRLIPTNIEHRIGSVNSRLFPQLALRDQTGTQPPPANSNGTVQFRPGTALLLPAKINQRAQNHPTVFNLPLIAQYFPLTVDVELNWLIFDPPTADRSTVNLSTVGLNGNAEELIRGHNLASLPRPITTAVGPLLNPAMINQTWVAFSNVPGSGGIPSIFPAGVNPSTLLYPYTDHEQIFNPPEPW